MKNRCETTTFQIFFRTFAFHSGKEAGVCAVSTIARIYILTLHYYFPTQRTEDLFLPQRYEVINVCFQSCNVCIPDKDDSPFRR